MDGLMCKRGFLHKDGRTLLSSPDPKHKLKMTTRARTVGSDNTFSEKRYPSHSDSYRQVIPDQYTRAVHSGNIFAEERYPSHPDSCRQVIPDQYIDQRKLQDLLENLFPSTDNKPKYMTKVSGLA